MAHFDSARNRVLWQRELAGLRREREKRQREGYDPSGAGQQREADTRSHVRRVTFRELEEMERESIARSREGRSRQRELADAGREHRNMGPPGAGEPDRGQRDLAQPGAREPDRDQRDLAQPGTRQPDRGAPVRQPGGMGL